MTGLEGFLQFVAVGVLAQTVDGALGMAYGVISTSVLLAFGVPPAAASAAVHAAEMCTTGVSAISHAALRNVAWRTFLPLMVGGVIGGIGGAYVLTGVDGDVIKPFIVGWLALMGVYILYRAFRATKTRPHLPPVISAPLGVVGGFCDAAGGGGWGPTVSSSIMSAGLEPRRAIGTTNTAEFFVTSAISATFVWALLTGRSDELGELRSYATAVGGLIVGGLIAAPLAGVIAKKAPRRLLTVAVGVLVIALAIYQGWRLLMT